MKLKRIAGFVSCFIMVSVFAKAQTDPPMLTLKDAVEIALKNNYNIVLAKNNQAIAQNNFTRLTPYARCPLACYLVIETYSWRVASHPLEGIDHVKTCDLGTGGSKAG